MRTPIPYLLLLVALVLSKSVVAATPDGLVANAPEYSLYDLELSSQSELSDEPSWFDYYAWERSDKIKRKGRTIMASGGVIAAAGIAVTWETIDIIRDMMDEANAEGNVAGGILGLFLTSTLGVVGIGMATVGIVEILYSLPYYTWGVHLGKSDLSTFNIDSEFVGFRGMLELGLSAAPSADIVYGYNYKDVFVGAGVGYALPLGEPKEFCVPAYLNVRWQISHSRVAPFVGAKAGIDCHHLTPFVAVDWGTRVRCKHSYNSWWYSLNCSTYNKRWALGVRVARSF